MSGDVTGPRWVGGVNAPASGGGDYEALVAEARKAQRAVYLAAPEPVAADLSRIIKGLADAVETLLAIEQRLTDHIVQLAAERDALLAESVEWSAQYQRLAEGVSDGQQ